MSNVSFVGEGTLYGNAEHYISYYEPEYNRFQPFFDGGFRPHLLSIEESQDVRVKGLRFLNSSNWNIHVRKSADVLIDGVFIQGDSRFPNNDGIEPGEWSGVEWKWSGTENMKVEKLPQATNITLVIVPF